MPAELHIKDGANWRKAKEVHVNDNGTWRKCKEVWYNDGGTWRKVFIAGTEFSLTPGSNPGGQASTLGYSTNPVRGTLSPATFAGYTINIIAEGSNGSLQIGLVTGTYITGLISGVNYAGRTLTSPLSYFDTSVTYYYWGSQGSGLFQLGVNIPFTIFG